MAREFVDRDSIARMIRRHMTEADQTQKEYALERGISPIELGRILGGGKPNMELLQALGFEPTLFYRVASGKSIVTDADLEPLKARPVPIYAGLRIAPRQ